MTRKTYGFVPLFACAAVLLIFNQGVATAQNINGKSAVAENGPVSGKTRSKTDTKQPSRKGRTSTDARSDSAANGDEPFDPKKFFEERSLAGGGM